jgi:hypothetical protein
MGKTKRSRAERREAAQAREDARYPLLAGQDDTAARAKLIAVSKGLRERYAPQIAEPESCMAQPDDHMGGFLP